MSAQTDNLKTQLSQLIDQLIQTSNNGPYSEALNDLIDQSLLTLQKLQDDISSDDEADILAGLKAHDQQLTDLNQQIDEFSKSLDASAAKIKGIADTVGTVAGVVAGIVSSGVL